MTLTLAAPDTGVAGGVARLSMVRARLGSALTKGSKPARSYARLIHNSRALSASSLFSFVDGAKALAIERMTLASLVSEARTDFMSVRARPVSPARTRQ